MFTSPQPVDSINRSIPANHTTERKITICLSKKNTCTCIVKYNMKHTNVWVKTKLEMKTIPRWNYIRRIQKNSIIGTQQSSEDKIDIINRSVVICIYIQSHEPRTVFYSYKNLFKISLECDEKYVIRAIICNGCNKKYKGKTLFNTQSYLT